MNPCSENIVVLFRKL